MTTTIPVAENRRIGVGKNRPGLSNAVILALIVMVQVAASLTLQNSAAQEESLLLFTGRDQLGAGDFSGATASVYGAGRFGSPLVYPNLAGIVGGLGGLEAARWLSTLCIVWLTVAVFLLARTIVSEGASVLGAAIFAVQAPVLVAGRSATPDALALALLVSSLLLLSSRRRPFLATSLGTVILVAGAICSSYGVWFVPSVLALTAMRIYIHGGGRLFGARLVTAASTIAVLTGLFLFARLRLALDFIQALVPAPSRTEVTMQIFGIGVLMAAFSAVALLGGIVIFRWNSARTTKIVAGLLLVTAVIAPSLAIARHDPASAILSLTFTAFFGAPVAGFAVSAALASTRLDSLQSLIIALTLFLLVFGTNVSAASRAFSAWPNSSRLVEALHSLVRANQSRVLVEEVEVPRYYLSGEIAQPWQFVGLNAFKYHGLQGDGAYRSALADGYFDVVVLRFGPSARLDAELVRELGSDPRYQKLESIPFQSSSGNGAYEIWRLEPSDQAR